MTIEVHRPKILDTKVLLLTGAGASKPLGMPLMRDFYSLVNSRSDKAQTELLNDISLVHLKETREVIPDLEALLALIDRYRGFYDTLFGDDKFGYPVNDTFKKRVEEWKELAEEEKRRADMERRGLLDSDTGIGSSSFASRDMVRDQDDYGKYLERAYCLWENLETLDTLLRDLMFEVYGKDLDAPKLDELYSPLFKVIGRHFYQGFIPVFTTNYDVAVETYAQNGNIPLEIGFKLTHTGNLWEASRFYQFQPTTDKQNIVLFKLHGSLTWHRKGDEVISTGLHARDPSGYKSVVIYPTQTKEFPGEEPIRTMYYFLKECLLVAKLAIVIGYSFRDLGIQRIMDDALEHNPNLRFVLVCGPNVDRWKKFTEQNRNRYRIIPHYFSSVPDGGEYLAELDAALAELKS